MIDIHCHLLPGIDDGASDLKQAVEMAQIAVEDGISHAILTPHIHSGRWPNQAATIREAANLFSKVLLCDILINPISISLSKLFI